MNIKFTIKIFCSILLLLFSTSVKSQSSISYSGEVNGSTYCIGSPTYDNWVTFFTALDTSLIKFGALKMSGTANSTAIAGRCCEDPIAVMRIANALNKKLAFSIVCNGFTFATDAGNCQVGGTCGSNADNVIFSADGTGTCLCNNQWVINPTIANANWGTCATTNCPPANQTIKLEFITKTVNQNLAVSIPPNFSDQLDGCSKVQNIKASFSNKTTNKVDSFLTYTIVNGTTFGPTVHIPTTKPTFCGQDIVVTTLANYTFTRNTNYNISIIISKVQGVNDGVKTNDTLKFLYKHLGPAEAPLAKDKSICGSQNVLLEATPDLPSDSIGWFANKNLTGFIGIGSKVLSPYLASGKTYKFWAFPFAGLLKGKLSTPFNATLTQSGNMFDVVPLKINVDVDSMELNISSTSSENWEVYIREGSYLDPGAITNAALWRKVASGTATGLGINNRVKVKFDYNFNLGKTYGVYVTLTSANIAYSNGANNYTDANIRIITGNGVPYPFQTPIVGRSWNGAFIYKVPVCDGIPDSAMIEVKPAPRNVSLSHGPNYQNAPLNSGNGSLGKPSALAFGYNLEYLLNPPTGTTNADHNTTWKVQGVSLRTTKGTPITTYTWADPTSTTPGKMTYTPTLSLEDSTLVASIIVKDLGPYNCDTTIISYIYVAPLPVPDYIRSIKVCDGDLIEFTNKSKIKTGFINHRWVFGDGDSTDAPDPIKQYPTAGTYALKYYAISAKYGYRVLKSENLVVTQIPQIAFKIENVCKPNAHKFTNSTTVASGALTYLWKYGNTATSTTALPVHNYTYANPGRYEVTLEATANGCKTTLTKNAYLFYTPVAKIGAPSGILCQNLPVNFTNSSTIIQGSFGHLWSMGDNAVQTEEAPKYKYAAPGTYKVKYVAISEFGCKNADSIISLQIQTAPKADFTNGQVCDKNPTAFTDVTQGIGSTTPAWAWNFGDGGTTTSQNPTHQYTTLGKFNTSLKVTLSNGCTDQITKILSVGTQPTVDFKTASVCFGQPIEFDNRTTYKSGNISYRWFFGNGDSSLDTDPIYVYNGVATQNYNVRLIAKIDGGCSEEFTKIIPIYELPNCNFTATPRWTNPGGWNTMDVSADVKTYPFYRYTFDDGGSSNTAVSSYAYQGDGIYKITLTARNLANCECTKTVERTLKNILGTNSATLTGYNVYPSPSTGMVYIDAPSILKSVKVYDMLGHLVYAKNENTIKTSLDLSNKANGMYLVVIQSELGTSSTKININK